MSAIEQLPPRTTPAERRNATRIRLDRVLPVRIGRNEGVMIDLSLRGARVRHSGTLLRGATVRMTFDWNRQKFAASAEVLASRVVMLGAREGESATYETRLRFTRMELPAQDLLARVLRTITDDELRTWVGNLKALDDEPRPGAAPRTTGYIRCRRIGNSWEKKWTRDSTQPADGFVLPAGTDAKEVEALCRAWMDMGPDERRLLQKTAEVVVQDAAG